MLLKLRRLIQAGQIAHTKEMRISYNSLATKQERKWFRRLFGPKREKAIKEVLSSTVRRHFIICTVFGDYS
jgi:hypothetical protein